LGLALLCGNTQGAEVPDQVRVELRNGQVLEGVLRRIEPSHYLIQSEETLYEVTGDEIVSVNGDRDLTSAPRLGRPVARSETYEVITAEGNVELWSKMTRLNQSLGVWTFVSWGAKEHELPMMRAMATYDPYGNRLDHQIEPRPGDDTYQVKVNLRVPVPPGETLDLIRRFERQGAVKRGESGWVYRFAGDFPEDRVHYRKLQLPRGAEVIQVDPAPVVQFEYEGHPIVVWRRYYPRGTESPQTVIYRLPEDSAADSQER
jgi:small nuclear ribonucleoprotein (snRNP)-like protein